MKFKIGNKVRIIGNTASHGFNNGDVAVVTKINRDDDTFTYLCVDTNNEDNGWWASEEDIELVGKQSDKEPVVYQYLIVNILSGIMFTVEDEQYLFTKEQVIEHLNNDIAYPSQWTVVSVNETFNIESIMKEVK